MLHGAGPALRSTIERANTWQRVLLAVALIAIGGSLVALGDVRAGLIGVLGVVLLVGLARQRWSGHVRAGGINRGDERAVDAGSDDAGKTGEVPS